MPASIQRHGQSTLPDGRVLISGGDNGDVVKTVYIYTPSSNTWTEVASLPVSFRYHGQSTLLDGRVFVSGGWNGSVAINNAYIYTPSDIGIGSWVTVASLPASIYWHNQTSLIDGRVLVAGGDRGSNNKVNTVYAYVSNTNTWNTVASLPVAFRQHGQSTLTDGRVFTSGGSADGSGNSYIYIPDSNTWTITASLIPNVAAHGQSTLSDNKVLISGGYRSGNLNTSFIYTTNAGIGTWITAASLPISFCDHGQSTLADGRVLVSGGTGSLNNTYIYTPAGWVAVGEINIFPHTAILKPSLAHIRLEQ